MDSDLNLIGFLIGTLKFLIPVVLLFTAGILTIIFFKVRGITLSLGFFLLGLQSILVSILMRLAFNFYLIFDIMNFCGLILIVTGLILIRPKTKS